MRKTLAVLVLAGAAALTFGQEEPPPPPRYGVPLQPDNYPQGTPKEALASAVKAAAAGKYDYLAAHLIDPGFIDARVADRANVLEPGVTRELQAVRDDQKRNPSGLPREARLPDDPKLFAEAVRAESVRRAFRLVTVGLRANLIENPDHLKDLRRYVRDGSFTDAGDSATAVLREQKGRQVGFRKVADGRWTVEDRQEPAPPVPEKK